MSSAADLVIVGGGPAGLMAGLLFARSGCQVRVLEKHKDFIHDFRGDTVHPSTMDVLADLGLLERFLKRPHQRLDRAQLRIGGEELVVGDLSRLKSRTPFVAIMPQREFLDFLRTEAESMPNFRFEQDVPVTNLMEERGRIAGAITLAGPAVHARSLVIAADGRRSVVRRRQLLPLKDLGSPIDVFWFELPKRRAEAGALRIAVDAGRILVRVDRGDSWQCAFVIPKGSAVRFLERGVPYIRRQIESVESRLGSLTEDLTNTSQLHLLEVSLDRLRRWHRPGLLAIGDAAHAMSPMGGIGINLAIQDAVAAANLLGSDIAAGRSVDHSLRLVQQRRYASTMLVQTVQRIAQNWVLAPMLRHSGEFRRPPWPLRLLQAAPALRRIPGRAIGFGIRRERVVSA